MCQVVLMKTNQNIQHLRITYSLLNLIRKVGIVTLLLDLHVCHFDQNNHDLYSTELICHRSVWFSWLEGCHIDSLAVIKVCNIVTYLLNQMRTFDLSPCGSQAKFLMLFSSVNAYGDGNLVHTSQRLKVSDKILPVIIAIDNLPGVYSTKKSRFTSTKKLYLIRMMKF